MRVLLTGASTGIGHATFRRLVDGGHDVTTVDVKPAPEGANHHVHADLAEPASVDALVDALDGTYDALANVAGVAGAMGAELALRVNVYGLRHLTERLLADGRIADGGSIVNIASMAGRFWERHVDRVDALDVADDAAAGVALAKRFDRGGPAAYVLSKEWVCAYTQRLAGRLLAHRIRVNSVSPGPVVTPLLPYFVQDAGPGALEWLNEQIGRAAEPDDIAQAVVWLLVGDSGWVNGVDLPVDGGMAAGLRAGWVALSRG